jgi:2,4-didehydro-3-deoxy-L-rhamnonate hydrolase
VMGTGANYRSHVAEMGMRPPTQPSCFLKPLAAIAGPDAEVALPPDCEAVDFEAELAVVIGAPAYRVTAEEAGTAIAGLTLADDVSARDLPMPQTPLAKGSPGFCPLGPAIVTLDELDLADIAFTLTLNGEPMQQGRTDDMVLSFAEIVASFAGSLPLEPGDVILTGTPSGVGVGRRPPRFLRDGDEVVIASPQLGRLRTRFSATRPVRPAA